LVQKQPRGLVRRWRASTLRRPIRGLTWPRFSQAAAGATGQHVVGILPCVPDQKARAPASASPAAARLEAPKQSVQAQLPVPPLAQVMEDVKVPVLSQ